MFFEIYRQGKLIKRGTKSLSDLSWSNELMFAPNTSMVLPIDYLPYINGREEIKIFINDKCFWGIIKDVTVDKVNETIDISIEHVITEWEYRQVSVNRAVSREMLNVIYKGAKNATKGGQSITANDFNISLTQLPLTNKQILAKARAYAWDANNGDKIDITVTGTIGSTKGDYELTLSTKGGASVKIKVTVTDKPKDESGASDPEIIDKITDIYNDTSFVYPGWVVDIEDDEEATMIDYVYSRQSKLEALTKTCELTPDLFWRVGFTNEKVVEIGSFGTLKPYIISAKPSGNSNIHILTEPTIDYDFDDVINVASVYGDKSDSGMSSVTLRDIYMNENLQFKGFPVVILREAVNNERDYSPYIQYPKLASNNYDEYAVIDEESVALEGGVLIEGTFNYNDLSAFSTDDKIVTDADRVAAAKAVYHSSIRKLKQARRSYDIEVVTEEIPTDLTVGDKVRFIYDNSLWVMEECSSYWEKILAYDDEFYITKIEYNFDRNGVETNVLTLTKWLKIDRDTQIT